MFGKNRKKTVGLCLMVVASCFILAGLWAVLATPETALAKGKPGSSVAYDMVIDTAGFDPASTALLTQIGDGNLGGSGPLNFFTRVTVTPTGSDYLIGVGKTGVVVQFKEHKGVLSSLSVAGNGANRVWHVSDVVPVDPTFTLVADDMVIVVNVDDIPIHRKNKSGPVIGTIAIGTIRLTVQ
jgi:hypothetical protein